MDYRLFKPHFCLGVVVFLAAPGAYLLSKNSGCDPAKMGYDEIVQALRKKEADFRLVPVGLSGDPRLGFMVLRADDPRQRDDLVGEMITRRRNYVFLRRTATISYDDALNLFRFRDGELNGDPGMIQEIVAALGS
jgi:hypothetical protein